MIIGTLEFAGASTTLGLDIVKDAILAEYPKIKFISCDHQNIKDADIVLVLLYWWRDVYAYVRFLVEAGIDPKKKKPILIIGGMSASNPRPLVGYFHYAVIGDGEACIGAIIRQIIEGKEPEPMPGLWQDGPCELATATNLPAKCYVDLRTNKTTRIEIARGCRGKCDFCQLAFMKPYRELDAEIIKHLVLTAPTKTISLFAPDRSSHSGIKKIDGYVKSYGKTNTGSDVRLEMLSKLDNISRIRFGVEGFSEKIRKKFHKVPTNKQLIKSLIDIAHRVKTLSGGPHRLATMYLIGDLPGEGPEEIAEIWEVLQAFDDSLDSKFTLFFSVSSFTPCQFTPMYGCSIRPYNKVNEWILASRRRYKHLIIASRGAVVAAPQRLSQMITVRGDERCKLAVHWLATKGWRYLKSTKNSDGKIVEAVVKKSGFDPKDLYRYLEDDYKVPWGNIKQPRPFKRWAREPDE